MKNILRVLGVVHQFQLSGETISSFTKRSDRYIKTYEKTFFHGVIKCSAPCAQIFENVFSRVSQNVMVFIPRPLKMPFLQLHKTPRLLSPDFWKCFSAASQNAQTLCPQTTRVITMCHICSSVRDTQVWLSLWDSTVWFVKTILWHQLGHGVWKVCIY